MDTSVFTATSQIVGWLAPAVPASLLIWIWYRSNSPHLLLKRLWLLVNGGEKIADKKVGAFLDDQTSLVCFRYHTGLQPATLQQAQNIIDWCGQNDVPFETVKKCREIFDINELRLLVERLPSKKLMISSIVLAGLLAGCTGLLAVTIARSQAALKYNESGHWFWVQMDSATPMWTLQDKPFYKSNCAKQELRSPQELITQREVDALCTLFDSKDMPQIIDNAVKGQRAIGASLIALLVFCLYWLKQFWVKADAAEKLSRKSLREFLPELPKISTN